MKVQQERKLKTSESTFKKKEGKMTHYNMMARIIDLTTKGKFTWREIDSKNSGGLISRSYKGRYKDVNAHLYFAYWEKRKGLYDEAEDIRSYNDKRISEHSGVTINASVMLTVKREIDMEQMKELYISVRKIVELQKKEKNFLEERKRQKKFREALNILEI